MENKRLQEWLEKTIPNPNEVKKYEQKASEALDKSNLPSILKNALREAKDMFDPTSNAGLVNIGMSLIGGWSNPALRTRAEFLRNNLEQGNVGKSFIEAEENALRKPIEGQKQSLKYGLDWGKKKEIIDNFRTKNPNSKATNDDIIKQYLNEKNEMIDAGFEFSKDPVYNAMKPLVDYANNLDQFGGGQMAQRQWNMVRKYRSELADNLNINPDSPYATRAKQLIQKIDEFDAKYRPTEE